MTVTVDRIDGKKTKKLVSIVDAGSDDYESLCGGICSCREAEHGKA